MIDLHTHILPGVDDGPATLDESLDMCRIAAEDGTRVVVASPHMLDGTFNVSRAAVLRGVAALRAHLAREDIPLAVEAGADVCLGADLCERVAQGDVITVGDRGKYLLLELPQHAFPDGVEQTLFQVQLHGITPILSHLERNWVVQSEPERAARFAGSGNLIQITAGSLTGRFGSRARKAAERMLASRVAHVVASDAHSTRGRRPGLSEARSAAAAWLPPEEIENVFDRRPERILAGEYVVIPEQEATASKGRRWFSWCEVR